MRNKLLTGVAAAALSFTIAGAMAQEPKAANPAGSSQGATSASPMSEGKGDSKSGGAASTSRGEERSAQGQRASEGAGRDGAGRNASENSSSAPRNSASDNSGKERNAPAAANAQSGERKTEQTNSAQRSGSDATKADAAKTEMKADANKADTTKSAAETNKSDGAKSNAASTTDTKSSTSSTANSNERNSDRNNATANKANGDMKAGAQQNNAASSSSSSTTDSAASTRTGSETKNTTASTTNNTNIQVRGELDIDRQAATRVHDRLIRDTTVRETNININVDVGGRVPDRVRLRPVPAEIVEISPRFRNYEYTVVRDEIIIVEPKTKKVVQIISGGGKGGASKHTVRLDTKQRDLVKRDVMKTRTGASRASDLNLQLREGVEIPDRVTLQTFPQEIYSEAPELREVRYVIIDEDVVLVDPDTREIIEVIR